MEEALDLVRVYSGIDMSYSHTGIILHENICVLVEAEAGHPTHSLLFVDF